MNQQVDQYLGGRGMIKFGLTLYSSHSFLLSSTYTCDRSQLLLQDMRNQQEIPKVLPQCMIRNAKILNIILLLAFFRTLSSNLDLEYPALSEENCLKNLLPLP